MHRPVSREAVEQAAKAARCHEFICSLPQGYETRLGDGVLTTSSPAARQAARIAIARAILKDTPIVILMKPWPLPMRRMSWRSGKEWRSF
ncbi:MAG: hypothetical protein ACLR23_06050 [Clostridia bacterium]